MRATRTLRKICKMHHAAKDECVVKASDASVSALAQVSYQSMPQCECKRHEHILQVFICREHDRFTYKDELALIVVVPSCHTLNSA